MKIASRFFLLLIPKLSVASAPHKSVRSLSERRALSGSYRTSSIDTTGLICQLGNEHEEEANVMPYDIPFYYAVGATGELDFLEMHKVQQNIFAAIQHQTSWCYKEEKKLSTMGNDRQLMTEALISVARSLGIISVSSGPSVLNAGECPDTETIQRLVKDTGATTCRAVKGIIRVLAHDIDNLEFMKAATLDAVEEALDDKKVWVDWQQDMVDIAFVSFLGDTREQAFPVSGDGAGLGLILGVGIPVVAALLLAALVVSRRRREHMTAREFHDMMNSDFVLVGTGDPLSSFHEGLYHYMRDGTRYLSTNCEACLETRRNSFYTDNNLGAIPEDFEFDENILITANSKDLSAKASTMNVHKCASGTCNKCHGQDSRETVFVRTKHLHTATSRSRPLPTVPEEYAEV